MTSNPEQCASCKWYVGAHVGSHKKGEEDWGSFACHTHGGRETLVGGLEVIINHPHHRGRKPWCKSCILMGVLEMAAGGISALIKPCRRRGRGV